MLKRRKEIALNAQEVDTRTFLELLVIRVVLDLMSNARVCVFGTLTVFSVIRAFLMCLN